MNFIFIILILFYLKKNIIKIKYFIIYKMIKLLFNFKKNDKNQLLKLL